MSRRYARNKHYIWLTAVLFLLSGVSSLSITAYGQPVQAENPVSDHSGECDKAVHDTATSKGVDEATKSNVEESYGKLPLYFIQNNGQADEKVRFYERSIGHTTSFTPGGVYLSFTPASKSPFPHESTEFSFSHESAESPFFNKSTQSPFSKTFTHFSPFSKGGSRGITQGNIPQNSQ